MEDYKNEEMNPCEKAEAKAAEKTQKFELGLIFAAAAFALTTLSALFWSSTYAVFVLAAQVALFAVLAVRGEKTDYIKSVVEALVLEFAYIVLRGVVSICDRFFASPLSWFGWVKLANVESAIFGVVYYIVSIAIAVFAVLALIKVFSGKAPDCVATKAVAEKILGIWVPKEKPENAPQPQYQPAPQQYQPAPQQVPKQDQPAPVEENSQWFCPSCGNANSGNFCTRCGNKKA